MDIGRVLSAELRKMSRHDLPSEDVLLQLLYQCKYNVSVIFVCMAFPMKEEINLSSCCSTLCFL